MERLIFHVDVNSAFLSWEAAKRVKEGLPDLREIPSCIGGCLLYTSLCDVMGIITEKKEEILDSEIEEMIAQRQQARKAKNFALADEIRGKLLEMGIVLEDTREGVKWKRA